MQLTGEIFERIKKILRDALLESWRMQGHYETGAVVEEIEYIIERTFDRTSFVAMMYPYGVYHESGVEAANIPFTLGSGAARSEYITALIAWVERRLQVENLQEARSVAFAIAQTQKREGMPTRGALAFSSTGQRTGWIDAALEKSGPMLGDYIRGAVRDHITTEFENLVTKQKTNL